MKITVLLLFLILISTILISQVITAEEIDLMERLLESGEEDLSSLDFLKDWSSSTRFKLPVVIDILNNPLRFPVYVEETDAVISSASQQQIMSKMLSDLYGDQDPGAGAKRDFKEYFNSNVSEGADLFKYVEYVWEKAGGFWKSAWQDLDDSEIAQLRYFTIALNTEAEDSLKYESFFKLRNISRFDTLEVEDIIPILEKIGFTEMAKSFHILQSGFDQLRISLDSMRLDHERSLVYDSAWGRMCIGTEADNTYKRKYCLIIDPGGNDIYEAELNSFEQEFFWLIDISGDDIYRPESVFGLFSAFMGAALSSDAEGDDIYQADDFAFSSLLGYQCHLDHTGDDLYRAGLHSLASSSFGLSLLMDLEGDDIYSVTQLGQGFAGTLAAAVLADYDGDDYYLAGGKYFHAPLAPLDHRSLSQGFGFGVRPDLGGGIGILFDNSGNDHYNGGVYAQGVAYWYALGILIDRSGNDFYDAVYYPQGSGIHLAGGFLFDEAGEDHYHSKHGPGQGAAHDYAVGFLVDREGNDCYSVEGGNGLGLTNSVGIFLDVSGNDSYGRINGSNYGYGNQARNSGSIGIFMDTGGIDSYAVETCGNDTIWNRGTYGFGIDTLMVSQNETVRDMAEENAVEIDSLASIEELFSTASEWGVGSAAERVKIAGKLLLKRDSETAKYIAFNQMDTKSALVYRAIEKYAGESTEFEKYWSRLLHSKDSLIVKNTIGIIGDVAEIDYRDSLLVFLDKGRYVNSVLSALGKMKDDIAVDRLKDYRFVDSEKTRVIVARGLKATDSDLSRKYLMEMEQDHSFLIRSMIRLVNEKAAAE